MNKINKLWLSGISSVTIIGLIPITVVACSGYNNDNNQVKSNSSDNLQDIANNYMNKIGALPNSGYNPFTGYLITGTTLLQNQINSNTFPYFTNISFSEINKYFAGIPPLPEGFSATFYCKKNEFDSPISMNMIITLTYISNAKSWSLNKLISINY